MRKAVVFALGLCFLLAATVVSWAVEGPPGVQYGWHNLSTSAPDNSYRSNEDEICIFCHTPHGGDATYGKPLWNRSNPSNTGWVFYNSATLSAAGKPSTVGVQSLMCLSCHDGSVAVNRILNPSGDLTPVGEIGQQPDISGGSYIPMIEQPILINEPGQSKRIGSVRLSGDAWNPSFSGTHNLSDDHPISVNYNAAYAFDTTGLNDPVFAEGRGVRFFGNPPERFIECPSCHDPHVNYAGPGGNGSYRPFLMTTNSYSYLCLSCHNK